eukprot:11516321-Heterocapsa_arctica.AAC.1
MRRRAMCALTNIITRSSCARSQPTRSSTWLTTPTWARTSRRSTGCCSAAWHGWEWCALTSQSTCSTCSGTRRRPMRNTSRTGTSWCDT